MKQGPMKQHVDRDTEGMVKAEYTTYTKKDGMFIKETSVRTFRKDGDYMDSFYSDPLVSLKPE
tara:strand:+ start:315 stop:503 length:189 start_codon:yes stop_codon:yes gene_type:complete